LPIPAIPCTQRTCVSPRRSSSRARSSGSRPTKGTRRRWGTAVAMIAVSSRAPRGARAGSDPLDDRDLRLGAHLLVASVMRDRGCHQLPEPAPSHPFSARRTEHVSTPGCHAGSRAATRPRTSRGRSKRSSAPQNCSATSPRHPVPAAGVPATLACRGMGALPRTDHRRPLWTRRSCRRFRPDYACSRRRLRKRGRVFRSPPLIVQSYGVLRLDREPLLRRYVWLAGGPAARRRRRSGARWRRTQRSRALHGLSPGRKLGHVMTR